MEAQRTLDELAGGIAVLLVIALLVVAADAQMQRTPALPPAPVRPTPQQRLKQLATKLHRTLRTVAMVLTLIACASSVGYIMALTQMPAKMTAFFLSISSNKYVILFLINILLLVLGTLVDMAPSILIATPILLPVMQNFGVDPVHFGMIMLLNLGIGLCHPPVGSILFVGCAVGKVTIEQVMRKIWPFYGVMFLVLMVVTYLPEVSLWLPRHVLR